MNMALYLEKDLKEKKKKKTWNLLAVVVIERVAACELWLMVEEGRLSETGKEV